MKYFVLILFSSLTWAKEIDTNALHMAEAPSWLTRPRTEKIIDRIQTKLEWTIRKINVYWHKDQDSFQRTTGMGGNIVAAAMRKDNSIHLGPRIENGNFDGVFGHELVHVISYQKYKGAIPAWLEEGMANYLGKNAKVDYAWLGKQELPADVRALTHPARGSAEAVHLNYVTSQALAEMIASKCDMTNLLRLSVERKMDDYLKTYCEINDLNEAYHKWVKKKSGRS